MSFDSVATFVDTLRRLQLLEPAQVDELTHTLQARFTEPQALARHLVQRGWLTPFQVNQLFRGRGPSLRLGSYVLLEQLGEGGMGAVYKARNWKLGKVLALKIIRKERLTDDNMLRRFQREIEAAAQMDHPNIIAAHDADEVDGVRFLAMEYVEGADLAQLVKKNGPLPVAQACDCIRQAALGLQHAHERGLIHRDIKPANLLLARHQALVKVLDLGLARLSQVEGGGESLSTMTQEGAVMGTPDFMAPEQTLDSHMVDIRADLYSLGCTLYFLLTGKPPFPGGTLGQKIARHQMREPTPVEQLRPEVTPALAQVVRKLMAKRPEDRYQTPLELVQALSTLPAAAVQAGPSPPPVPTALAPTLTIRLDETSSPPPLVPPRLPASLSGRTRLLAVVAGSTLLVLGLVALVFVLTRPGPRKEAAREPSPRPEEKSKPPGPQPNPQPTATDGALTIGNPEEPLPGNRDFMLQGEYLGHIGADERPMAAQVIALGSGTFRVRLLPGGLPGAGWTGEVAVEGTAETTGETTSFTVGGWKGVFSQSKVSGHSPENLPFNLKHVYRKSATLGAKPPQGALVLFAGPDLEAWDGGAKLLEDRWLSAGATTRKAFRDFHLHLEFRIPFLPAWTGQQRGNSGVFLQNRYEVQILDSFGLPPSKVDCGALYGQTEPSVNACLPPLSWQTYDIDFRAARFDARGQKTANAVVTVRHNGILIHKDVEVSGLTGLGQPEADSPSPIHLQLHGSDVAFRNIWIVEKP